MPRLELTVVFDGETVGLLLDLADQGEHRGDRLDADFPPIRMDQGTGTVPVVLYHTEGGDLQPH